MVDRGGAGAKGGGFPSRLSLAALPLSVSLLLRHRGEGRCLQWLSLEQVRARAREEVEATGRSIVVGSGCRSLAGGWLSFERANLLDGEREAAERVLARTS